jgi:hypothetical protein
MLPSFWISKSDLLTFDPRETSDVIDNLSVVVERHDGCTHSKRGSPVLLSLEIVFRRRSPKERKTKHAM